jgi:ubiquinone/menaquinone biosynthesis C-methylase UbiE
LDYEGIDGNPIQTGTLICPRCKRIFPIENGIPQFIQPESLTGFNRRFSHLYDWFSWVYRAFSKIAFAYIGMDEEIGRREITDRLDPHGGRVLEVSIGPGVNLPYLVNRSDVGEVFGLDISIGQLQRCQRYVTQKGWGVDLFLGNGEQLPFRDESFEGVFHVGGINFFNDKKSAIDEMIRVAKPGARILIADETEKGARGYEKFIPGFKKSFDGKRQEILPPIDLIPANMVETRLLEAWKGWLYCIEFRKP